MFITRVVGKSYQELVTFTCDWRLLSTEELISVQALFRPHKMDAEETLNNPELFSKEPEFKDRKFSVCPMAENEKFILKRAPRVWLNNR